MKPSEILYSCATITPTLSGGDNIESLIEQIASGNRVCDRDWFPLEVAKYPHDGRWYTHSNKLLYIFKILEKQGIFSRIEVSANIVSSGMKHMHVFLVAR